MNNTSRTQVLSIVGVAVVMLVIGVAIGSVAFPATKIGIAQIQATKTETTTITLEVPPPTIQKETVTVTQSPVSNGTVTITELIIQESLITWSVGACTLRMGVSNSTGFITPSVPISQTYVTVTVTTFSNTTSTITIPSSSPVDTKTTSTCV